MRLISDRRAYSFAGMTDAELRGSRRLCAATLGGSVGLMIAALCGHAGSARAQLLTLDLLNGQLIDLDARVTVNGDAITGLAGQIGAQADAVTALGSQLTATTQAAAALDARVGAVEAGVSANAGLGAQVSANGGAIAGLDGRLTANDTADAALAARVGSAETALDDHAARIAANTAGLLALDDQVAANTGAIADLGAGLEAGTIGMVRQPTTSGPISVGAQTGGDAVAFAGTDGDRRLTGVAPGIAPDDAATMGQLTASAAQTLGQAAAYADRSAAATLAQANGYTDQAIARSNRAMRRAMDAMGAGNAALSGLPQSILPGEGMIGAGIGGHGDAVAVAVGLSKAFRAPHTPVVRAGASFDTLRGGVTYNAAVGLHF